MSDDNRSAKPNIRPGEFIAGPSQAFIALGKTLDEVESRNPLDAEEIARLVEESGRFKATKEAHSE